MVTNPIPAPPLQGRGHEFFEYIIPCYNYNASICRQAGVLCNLFCGQAVGLHAAGCLYDVLLVGIIEFIWERSPFIPVGLGKIALHLLT